MSYYSISDTILVSHGGNTPSDQLQSVTAIWSGKHHLVCPSPTLAGVLPAGGWVGAYQTITQLLSAAFDIAFDKL